jgi:hypothetical protein
MSSPTRQDEETPLLQRNKAPRQPTPLPKAQIFLLLLLRLAEPITSNSISPYISEVCFVVQLFPNLTKWLHNDANYCLPCTARQRSVHRWW